jgi:hypothetical protein
VTTSRGHHYPTKPTAIVRRDELNPVAAAHRADTSSAMETGPRAQLTNHQWSASPGTRMPPPPPPAMEAAASSHRAIPPKQTPPPNVEDDDMSPLPRSKGPPPKGPQICRQRHEGDPPRVDPPPAPTGTPPTPRQSSTPDGRGNPAAHPTTS